MHDPIRAFLDRLDKELLAFAQELYLARFPDAFRALRWSCAAA
jgi:hypothetical protein